MRATIILMVFVFTAAPVAAQEDLSITLGGRAGVAIPTGEIADGNASAGPALGLEAAVRFMPAVGAYLRLTRAAFGVEQQEGEPESDLTEGGISAGVRGWIPVAGPVAPWGEVGAVYHSYKASFGAFGFEIGPMLGFEVGVGGDYAIPGLPLVAQPSARYRSYSGEMEFFGTTERTTISYVEIGVGVAFPIRVGT